MPFHIRRKVKFLLDYAEKLHYNDKKYRKGEKYGHTEKIFNSVSLIINLLIIGFTIYAVSQFFTGTGDGNMAVQKVTCFRYFTVDSNILAAIMSAVMLVFNIKKLKNKDAQIPKRIGTL